MCATQETQVKGPDRLIDGLDSTTAYLNEIGDITDEIGGKLARVLLELAPPPATDKKEEVENTPLQKSVGDVRRLAESKTAALRHLLNQIQW